MSGLSRTPGKRVWDNIPTGVRIPPSPPNQAVIVIYHIAINSKMSNLYLALCQNCAKEVVLNSRIVVSFAAPEMCRTFEGHSAHLHT